MADYVVSSGQVSSGIILNDGTMEVLSGGTAVDTLVTSSSWSSSGWYDWTTGRMWVSSGGTAIQTVIDGGSLEAAGGTLIDTVVSNGGHVYLYPGNYGGSSIAVVSNMRVGAGGWADIYGARSIDSVEVESGGYFTCDPGDGTLNNITVRAGGTINGFRMDEDTAYTGSFHVSGVVIGDHEFAQAQLYKNQTGTNITIGNYGYLSLEGGSLTGTVVHSGGSLWANGSSVLTNTMIESGGMLNGFYFLADTAIASGIDISNTIVYDYANLYKSQTGSNITVANSGYLYVTESAVAQSIFVQSGGSLSAYESSTLSNTTIESGGVINGFQFGSNVFIKSGVTLSGGIVAPDSYGYSYANLYEGQAATDTRVLSGGSLRVDENVQLSNTFVAVGGRINGFQFDTDRSFASGLHISGGTVSDNADVYCGQSAKDVTVLAGGNLDVHSDASASNITVKANGRLNGFLFSRDSDTVFSTPFVFSNGIVEGQWHPYDDIYPGEDSGYWGHTYAELEEDMKAYGTVINAYGDLEIDGIAYDTTVNFGGSLTEDDGAEAIRVTVNNGGYFCVRGDSKSPECGPAYASYALVNSGGTMHVGGVKNGKRDVQDTLGIASHTTVFAGGTMTMDKTGAHRGTLTIEDGAKVTADAGSVIDFTVSEMSASDPARINNLSLVQGTPDYTVTVSSNQAKGTYTLANGAAGFGGMLTLGTEKEIYGTITVNGSALKHGSKSYTLTVADDSLQLTVSGKNTPTPAPATVIDDLGAISVGETVGNSLGYDGNIQDNAVLNVGTPGTYMLDGNFGALNASVTISSGSKAVAKGTIKNGVLTFNKGNPVLLTRGDYSLELKSSDKGKTASEYTFAVNAVTLFDKGDNDSREAPRVVGSVTAPGQTLVSDGWVGYGDEYDYLAFSLDHAANLSLDYTASDAAKFTLFNVSTGKSVLNSTLKGGTLTTKAKLLEAGNYYLMVQSTNAKKGGSLDYTVSVSPDTRFFTRGDNSDDTFETAKDLGAVTGPGVLDTDWVGVGDAIDYKKITLASGGKLSFSLTASDGAKLMVYQAPGGKAVGTATVKGNGTASTKDIFVSAGTYYLAVQSTKAKKDGYADYSVALNENSRFFPAGDPTNNTWQAASGQPAKLPGEEITGWVGYGDAADFIKFQVAGEGQIILSLDDATEDALERKEIKLSCLDASGKSVALTAVDDDILVSKKSVSAGEYYLGVTCANVKKFDTSYSITTGLLAV